MAEPQRNILVIEDEREIRELMALHLLRQGFKVQECASVEEALMSLDRAHFDLVVLDWMLPGQSGIDFLERYQNRKQDSSVLMVTARAEPEDIVFGLEHGADDYLMKPFEPSVFLARVRALLRRSEAFRNLRQQESEVLSLGGLQIDLRTYEVRLKDQAMHFTPSEFKLLVSLIQSQGKVLTRDHLIEQIQGEGVNVIGRTIDTHVFGLRKKLGEWGDRVETIRGVGYRVKVDS